MKIELSGTANGGEVTKTATASISADKGPSNVAVVVARDGNGNLRVQAWRVGNSDEPVLASETTAGAVSEVAVAPLEGNRVVAAVRDGAGELRVISYAISANGAKVTRLKTATAGKIVKVAASIFDRDAIITAARLSNGQVRIMRWRVGSDGSFDEPAGMTLGSAGNPKDPQSMHSDVCGNVFSLGVHAGRTAGGTLRLRAFNGVQSPDGSGTGGKIFNLSIADGFGDDYFVGTIDEPNADVRTGLGGLSGRLILDTGTMRLAKWTFVDGNPLKDLELVSEGALNGMASIAWEIKVLSIHPTVITALAGADTFEKALEKDRGKPKLRMIVWKEVNGKLERAAQANVGGKHREISLARMSIGTAPSTTNSGRFLSASRVGGDLKVSVWRISDD